MENNLVNFYAKLGLAGLLTSLKINDPQNTVFFNPGSYSQSSSHLALTYGAGIEYLVKPRFAIYTHQ